MNEQTYRHTNKQTYRRTYRRTNKRTDGRTNERTNKLTDEHTNKKTYKQIYKLTNVQTTMSESVFSFDEIRRQSFIVFNILQYNIQLTKNKHKPFFTLPLELCFRIQIENTNKLTLLFTILKYNNLKTK